ncbi:MAG: non-ribosomal peptide synthetase, partial [Gammaproteobacteria bacterium]
MDEFNREAFFCTDDIFSQENNLLFFHGRKDVDSIKINGILVNLNEVCFYLKKHPAVNDARVIFSKKLSRIIACVIYKSDFTDFNVLDYLKEKIIAQAVPQEIICFNSFPLTTTGKTDIQAIIKAVELREQPTSYSSLGEGLSLELVNIIREFAPTDTQSHITLYHLSELGIDSISLSRLVNKINLVFKLRANPICIKEVVKLTLSTLDVLIKERVVMEHNNTQTKSILFLFPPISGEGAVLYQETKFVRVLKYNNGLSVRYLTASTLSNDDIVFNDDDLINDFTNTILNIQPEGNYYLAGWSDGGIKAWKVAEELEKQGKTIRFLGLIDSTCPYFYRGKEELYQHDLSQLIEMICIEINQKYDEKLIPEKKNFKNNEDMLSYINNELVQQATNKNVKKLLSVMSYSLRMNQQFHFTSLKTNIYIYIAAQTQEKMGSSDLGWKEVSKDCQIFLIN